MARLRWPGPDGPAESGATKPAQAAGQAALPGRRGLGAPQTGSAGCDGVALRRSRRPPAAAGSPWAHASLFTFLTQRLGLSKAAAFFRMKAAELIRRHPDVIEPLRDGRLCLTTLASLARVLTDENRAEVLPRFRPVGPSRCRPPWPSPHAGLARRRWPSCERCDES
jgi:hypothetical protein